MREWIQSADWKAEKHVPVIEVPQASKGQPITVKVSIGKEIPHPNNTQHHITWIELYFKPNGAKFPYQIGKAEFTAHGASVDGPDSSGVYTDPQATFVFKTEEPGELSALAYCNIHGLWSNQATLTF